MIETSEQMFTTMNSLSSPVILSTSLISLGEPDMDMDPLSIVILSTLALVIGILVSICICVLQIGTDPKREPCWVIVSSVLCIINMSLLFSFILQIHGRIHNELETNGEITSVSSSFISMMLIGYFIILLFQFLVMMKSCGWDKKCLEKCLKKWQERRRRLHRKHQVVPITGPLPLHKV